MTKYSLFPVERVELSPIAERGHDFTVSHTLNPLEDSSSTFSHPDLPVLDELMRQARNSERPIVLFMGAHLIKLGLSAYVNDLIDRGWITHVATNGASIVHDYELASEGGTSENVARWISAGKFGLWRETSRINEIIKSGNAHNEGLGECLGREIAEGAYPHSNASIAATAWNANVPFTVHVSIGSDIIHAHPNVDAAALGLTSYCDFRIFAETISRLEGGVFLNVGSAITGPEVFLKALSMARNVRHQAGERITDFATAVFDLVPLPNDFRDGVAPKSDPSYYFRPWKTLLVRTVADGGRSFYFRGDHSITIPALWHTLRDPST